MYLTIPLALTSEIFDFSSQPIESSAHQSYVTDISNGSQIWPYRQYRSSPHTPPHLEIKHTEENANLAEGYLFVTPSSVNGKDGTMELQGTGFIMTSDGDLVYAAEENGMGFCERHVSGMTDFRRQDYDGRPYLTYWNGCNTKGTHWGHRWGRVTFIDDQYENFTINPELNVKTQDVANIGQIDVHEHEMASAKTMLVSSYNNTPWDLSKQGGPKKGWLADSLFFEVNVETGNVVFEWRAAEHIPLSKSRMSGAANGFENTPWDWFHINSVQKVGENYLISARHLWAAFLVSGKTGDVIWTLDGIDGGNFSAPPEGARFRWQHHARAQNIRNDSIVISVFNNFVNGPQNVNTQTRGMAYELPLPPSKKKPIKVYRQLKFDKDPVFSGTQGSYQVDIGNGNGFVGYGSAPIAREFSPEGKLLWSAQYGELGAVQSYRATKQKWKGTPKNWNPKIVVERSRARSPRAYVSWNGATEIEGWAVYAGDSMIDLKSVGVAKKRGFETMFEMGNWRCVQVGAIRDGKILRASNKACLDA